MKLIAGLIVLLAVLGCGPSPEQKVVGTWKVDTAKSSINGEKLKSESDRKELDKILQGFKIELREDKSGDVLVIFPNATRWSLNGTKLTMTPTDPKGGLSFNGKSTFEFDVDPSGNSMSADVDALGLKGKLVFEKNLP